MLVKSSNDNEVEYIEWILQKIDTKMVGIGSAQDDRLMVVVDDEKINLAPQLLTSSLSYLQNLVFGENNH